MIDFNVIKNFVLSLINKQELFIRKKQNIYNLMIINETFLNENNRIITK